METIKVTRINITEHLIEYELSLAGRTLGDCWNDDTWQFNFTLTREQYGHFRGYSIPLLKKTFRINKRKAESIFGWFWKQFGLRIKN